MEHNTGQLGGCAVLVMPLVSLMINQVESKLFGKEVKMAVLLFGNLYLQSMVHKILKGGRSVFISGLRSKRGKC